MFQVGWGENQNKPQQKNKHPMLPSPLLNFSVCSLPTWTDWTPHSTYTVKKILTTIIGHDFCVSTHNYKHATENFTTKITGASTTYCAAQNCNEGWRTLQYTHTNTSYWARMQGTAL